MFTGGSFEAHKIGKRSPRNRRGYRVYSFQKCRSRKGLGRRIQEKPSPIFPSPAETSCLFSPWWRILLRGNNDSVLHNLPDEAFFFFELFISIPCPYFFSRRAACFFARLNTCLFCIMIGLLPRLQYRLRGTMYA